MSVSPEVIDSLKVDLALEHAAIIQYVIGGVLLRDSGMTDPVRKIAREEMWHFEWLVEAIRDRQGVYGLDREEVFLPPSLLDALQEDVAAENRALSHYAVTLGLVGDSDARLTRLLERIAEDERHHRAIFTRLAGDVRSKGDAVFSAHPITGPEDLAVVGPTIAAEYATLLQYLWNKYGCGNCEAGERYFDFAVDEMRHLSWAAAYVPGLVAAPVPPEVPADRVRQVGSTAEAREAAEVVEQGAAAFFPGKIEQASSEALKWDLDRALGHHDYHSRELDSLA